MLHEPLLLLGQTAATALAAGKASWPESTCHSVLYSFLRRSDTVLWAEFHHETSWGGGVEKRFGRK